MNQPMQPIIQHLFQTPALEDISREQLESFVAEYPCFGFGHYLLTRKLQADNAEHLMAATRKASLYFSNPFWLQWLLENAEPAEAPTLAPEPGAEAELEAAGLPDDMHAEMPTEEPEPVAAEPEGSSAADQLLNSIEEAKELRESLQRINEDFHTAIQAPEEPVHTSEEPIHDEEPPFVLAEQEADPLQDVEPPFILDEQEPELNHIASEPDYKAPEPQPIHTEPAPTTDTPVFEPYHTIDYFASQGIRLTLDENPSDSLGKQLKSFTEWLKVMRKLPQKERELIPDRVAEETIQTIAAHSIESKEIITETMAEVLAMQGMPERARLVYEKLSLLNPDKRTYFAAKIEQLNIP